jgi:hypothetical protein
MDLRRKLDLDQLNDLYPGHFDPEVSLFTYDSVNKIINNDFKDVSNDKCTQIADSPIPPKCIQLIRFRGRPPTSTASSSFCNIENDIESLVSVFDRLCFPLSPIVQAGRNLRLELGRYLTKDADDNQLIFYLGGSRTCLVWVYYRATSSTRAVMVNFMQSEFEAALRLHDFLRILIMPDYQLCFNHPMFLALVLVRMVEMDTMQGYTSDAVRLQEIENEFVTIKSAGRIETLQRLRDLGRLASQDTYMFYAL